MVWWWTSQHMCTRARKKWDIPWLIGKWSIWDQQILAAVQSSVRPRGSFNTHTHHWSLALAPIYQVSVPYSRLMTPFTPTTVSPYHYYLFGDVPTNFQQQLRGGLKGEDSSHVLDQPPLLYPPEPRPSISTFFTTSMVEMPMRLQHGRS